MRSLKTLQAGQFLPVMLLFFSLFIFTTAYTQPTSCGCDPTTNLVPEGDFEITGNSLPVAYSTSLNHLCACNYPGGGGAGYGSYCIDTDAYLKCTSFDNTYDHTTGSGKFMIVDGFPTSDPPTPTDPNIVWKYGVNIATPGTYEFSFWWHPNMSSSTSTLPVLDFRVDYTAVVSGIGGTSATLDTWNEFCTSFTIVDPGFHVFEIGQTNTGNGSNDYGIDDIFLGHCCTCDITANFTATPGGAYTMNFASTTTSNSCTTPAWYYWDFGDSNQADGPTLANVSHTYAGPGVYTVWLTVMGVDANGNECWDKIPYEIKVSEVDLPCKVTAAMTPSASTSLLNVTNNSFDPIDIDAWTYQIYDPPCDPNMYTTYSGAVASGADASLHPMWNVSHPTSGPGVYCIYLCVWDYDVPPFGECYDCTWAEIEVPEDPTGDCDVVADFTTNLLGGSTYAFANTSTASSALQHNWTVTNLGTSSVIYTANTSNLNYTFPGNGTYQVCLSEYQPDGGGECFDQHCITLIITDAPNYLDFTLGYDCNDPEPTLFISSLWTNAASVDITTNCSGYGNPVTTPGANTTGLGMPVTPPNYPVANQDPYGYSSCTVCVTDANGLTVCHYIYFNCQPCPGSPKSMLDDGTGKRNLEGGAVEQLQVFPNPVNGDEVQVRVSDLYGPTELNMLDISGKVVRSVSLDLNVSSVQIPFDIKELPAGVYFFQLLTDDGIQVQKLIIE